MGSRPVARGSRVPPWPALAAWNRRRTAPTAWVEVMPAGLSRTSQPSTFSPRRLAATALLPILTLSLVPTLVLWSARLVLVGFRQILGDRRAAQQHLDAVGLAEGPVGLEADRGGDAEIDRV